jgi:hypothetical protein
MIILFKNSFIFVIILLSALKVSYSNAFAKFVHPIKANSRLTDDFIYGSSQILKRSRLESYRQGKTKDKFAIENNEITASKLIIGLNIVMYIITKGLPGFTNGDSRSKLISMKIILIDVYRVLLQCLHFFPFFLQITSKVN